jgi:hypothetical protein
MEPTRATSFSGATATGSKPLSELLFTMTQSAREQFSIAKVKLMVGLDFTKN